MKKVTYIAIVFVAFLVSFASCRKEYRCFCSYNNQLVRTIDLGNQKKSDAQSQCAVYDTSMPGEVWTCTVGN